MLNHIIEFLGGQVIAVETVLGLWGIALLMGIESACIPLPSEVIMPFAGYLALQGKFSLFSAALCGAVGCVVGSLVAYYAGAKGGRPLAEKYGKYILMNPGDLELADRLFKKYGDAISFFSRLLPVVRTFIAFPAGVARTNVYKFSVYTFLGSFPWCFGLAWIGYKLGENWSSLHEKFHQIDLAIAGIFLIGGIFWVRHHLLFLKSSKTRQKAN
jgi:membrane protein DedA with SNARE-associated domain